MFLKYKLIVSYLDFSSICLFQSPRRGGEREGSWAIGVVGGGRGGPWLGDCHECCNNNNNNNNKQPLPPPLPTYYHPLLSFFFLFSFFVFVIIVVVVVSVLISRIRIGSLFSVFVCLSSLCVCVCVCLHLFVLKFYCISFSCWLVVVGLADFVYF